MAGDGGRWREIVLQRESALFLAQCVAQPRLQVHLELGARLDELHLETIDLSPRLLPGGAQLDLYMGGGRMHALSTE